MKDEIMEFSPLFLVCTRVSYHLHFVYCVLVYVSFKFNSFSSPFLICVYLNTYYLYIDIYRDDVLK